MDSLMVIEYLVLAKKVRRKKGQTGMIVTRNKESEKLLSFKTVVYFSIEDFKYYNESQRRNGHGHK